MREEFDLNQGQSLEEMRDPFLGKAITCGRREAPAGGINIAEKNGHIIGPMMIIEGKVIFPTKLKITGGKMDTPTKEAPEDLSIMTNMNIPGA